MSDEPKRPSQHKLLKRVALLEAQVAKFGELRLFNMQLDALKGIEKHAKMRIREVAKLYAETGDEAQESELMNWTAIVTAIKASSPTDTGSVT